MKYKPEQVARIIDFPVSEWPGNCYGVACLCLKKGVVQGKARYGHWRGPIHPKSMFARMSLLGFCQHGWVETLDGLIFDPTRWVFEMVPPYIYHNVNDFYDVGGNVHRKQHLQPPPKFDGKNCKRLVLSKEAEVYVRKLLGDKRRRGFFSFNQLFWLSNLPLDMLAGYAKDIYAALRAADCGALIPMDNWDYIMEEEEVKSKIF